ncbi:MAG: ATP-binding protein [Alkalispirochaeta sp.]
MHYTLGEYILDLVQNSVEAAASQITLTVAETDDAIRVTLTDDGRGMDAETLRRALDPFYTDGVKHPGRTVGLGLPFLRQMLESIGGAFEIESTPGEGTTLAFTVPVGHIDAPPTGEITGTVHRALCFSGGYEMTIRRIRGTREYTVRRGELRDALGELDTAGSQELLEDYIRSQEADLEDN